MSRTGTEKEAAWLKRIEEIIDVLEGSTIAELEMNDGGTDLIIRRTPGVVATIQAQVGQIDGVASIGGRERVADKAVPILTPITGVYYGAASPSTPPFVAVGDTVNIGQVVALVEAMKVFNEITAEVAGRVVALEAVNGNVVQKGEVLLRIEPM